MDLYGLLGLGNTPTGDPSSYVYNPGAEQRHRLSSALLGLGAGMLTGGDPRYPQTFGAALGRGAAGFGAGLQQGNENMQRDRLLGLETQKYGMEAQRYGMEAQKYGADTAVQWDAFNRQRAYRGLPPVPLAEFRSGNWGTAATGQPAGNGAAAMPASAPMGVAAPGGAGMIGQTPIGTVMPSGTGSVPTTGGVPNAPGNTTGMDYKDMIAQANRALQFGQIDDAKYWMEAAKATPEYQATVKGAEANATMGHDIAVAQAGKAYINTPTQIINSQEGAAAKGIGEGIAKVYNDIQTAGFVAPTAIANNEKLNALLQDAYSGKYANDINSFVKGLKALGVDPAAVGITDKTAVTDAATAVSRIQMLQMRNPSGGAGMPGSLSDRDVDILQSMTANPEMVKETSPLLLEFNNRLKKRDIDIAKVARDYKNASLPGKAKGIIDDGVYDAIQKFADDHPLFTEADRAKIKKLSGGPSSPATATGGEVPTFSDPSDPRLLALPPGTVFRTPDGRLKSR